MSKIRHPEKINKPSNPIKKKPTWIRSKITNSQNFFLTKRRFSCTISMLSFFDLFSISILVNCMFDLE